MAQDVVCRRNVKIEVRQGKLRQVVARRERYRSVGGGKGDGPLVGAVEVGLSEARDEGNNLANTIMDCLEGCVVLGCVGRLQSQETRRGARRTAARPPPPTGAGGH